MAMIVESTGASFMHCGNCSRGEAVQKGSTQFIVFFAKRGIWVGGNRNVHGHVLL